jgi:sulfotransferase
MRRIHFISGIPRSGSTLLAAILRQNPRFHAEMSSPLAAIYGGLLERMSPKNEFYLSISDAQRTAVCEGLFSNFYRHLPVEAVVFDTSRVWSAKLPDLVRLFSGVKMICCVRSLAWVLDSVERLSQQNPFYCSKLFNFDPSGTVYSHVDALMNGAGAVGMAYNALKGAFFGPQSSHLVLVTYESLAKEPARTMKELYRFLDEAPYDHDFSSVSYSAPEFDRSVATPDLHTISGAVRYTERETLLPPDLVAKFANSMFWKDGYNGRRPVLVL